MAKLYFYYSAMNAGKTTTLLQSDYNYRERGMRTQVFTALVDQRYHISEITSRIGLKRQAICFDEQFDFIDFIGQDIKKRGKLHCILVDEAQFLSTKQVHQLATLVDDWHIPTLCYGIRTDFQAQLFPGSQELLALAEEICEIKTICLCGHKATMNMRLDAQGKTITTGDQVFIGGNDQYISLCRACFNKRYKDAL